MANDLRLCNLMSGRELYGCARFIGAIRTNELAPARTRRGVGNGPAGLLPTAAAIELIHTYSLIHDDLPAMDDDELRRGRPTSHVVHGEDVAILAGDAMFAEAIRLIAERQQGEPDRVLLAIREISAATGVDGMVGGQYVDVTGGGTDAASLRELHSLKTGRLIAASIGSALVLSGVEAERADPFRRFAAELGVLFQIVDDILDVTGSDEELGKPSGSDERHGKVTYVSLFGLERARALAEESHATRCRARRRGRRRRRPRADRGLHLHARRPDAGLTRGLDGRFHGPLHFADWP